MRPNDLLDVSNRFAKRAGLADKKALQREFMAKYRNSQLLMAIAQKGPPSVMPVGLSFQQHTGQSWSEAQSEWLEKHQDK